MFFNTSGIPVGTAFTLFDTLGGKIPFLTAAIFGNNQYLVVTTRLILSYDPISGYNILADGDVYGKVIQPSTTGINEDGVNLTAQEFSLSQNYPNPFNPSTSISFKLSASSFVSLKIFDLLGREVTTIVSEQLSAGDHLRQWNAVNIPSGIYFYRLQNGSFTETKKLVLLR
jgi:hypothetical protein